VRRSARRFGRNGRNSSAQHLDFDPRFDHKLVDGSTFLRRRDTGCRHRGLPDADDLRSGAHSAHAELAACELSKYRRRGCEGRLPAPHAGGILSGITTPTEVSAFAIVYGLVLAVVIYRAIDLRAFARILRDSATLSGMILFILAAAQCFSWVLTNAYVPQRLVELLHALHDSPALFMLGSIVLLIVAGSLLEGLPALNVLAPLLVPIAARIGVSPLHFGIVLVIAMGIGAFLPPTGVGFYVCCAISRASIEEGSRAMVPYLAILIVGLLIVAFVPWFTLFLPRLAGLRT
jgi:TRAP-type C4-dicarboxylate transport system permease large subunit